MTALCCWYGVNGRSFWQVDVHGMALLVAVISGSDVGGTWETA